MPTPVAEEYRPQAEAFYENNPGMNNYLEVKMAPLIKPEPKITAVPIPINLQWDAENKTYKVVESL